MSDVGCCWKHIPLVDVPLRYLITLLAESRCCGEGLVWYVASMFVIVVMSGRVLCESHRRLPIILRICSIVVFVAGVVGGLIESTGKPFRYGVGAGLASCRLVACTSVSMNAGCDK